MLIRPGGYNTGAQEYLETGNKSGREFTRDELDHRLLIDGNLDLTRAIYESIPDHGQDRYVTFTLSFKEDSIAPEVLKAITTEFKQFLMQAYEPGEFNFYAEAHLPKMKTIRDKKTGELIDRKPHIHIIVPRINLLSGNEANPVDVYMNHVKYFEAFQESINQKYQLASPRENVRADITDAASVLSRYKGDDFYGKNREFKQSLVTEVISRNITSRADFYSMVAEYGETRIRNQGKDNEYLSVKLPGDAKGTNLKETIFQDDFIVRRELKKPPLDPDVISTRLQEWPQRSKEIKYIHKQASPAFRDRYWKASPEDRVVLLAERERKFYQTYGSHHDDRFVSAPRDHQRSPAQTHGPGRSEPATGLPDLSGGVVADHGQTEPTLQAPGAVLLPRDAHIHVGQRDQAGDPGLRPAVREGRGRRGGAGRTGSEPTAAVPAGATRTGAQGAAGGARRAAAGRRAEPLKTEDLPPDARNPYRVRSLADIEARGRRLFGSDSEPTPSPPQAAPKRKRKRFEAEDPRPVYARNPNRVASMADIEARGRRLFGSVSEPAPGPPQAAPKRKRKRFEAVDPRPLYARNPHRVAGITDIEARAKRLFDSQGPVDPARLVRLPSIKPLLINRQASTVAAYFTRQVEHNSLKPAQRQALRRINKQFFDTRRAVLSDLRLTRQDKAQLVSVLTFERLKAREAIQNPQHHQEVSLMGSAEIRQLITEEEIPGFSISGPAGQSFNKAGPEGVRARAKQALDMLSRRLDPKPQTAREQQRERDLNAKDLYTRKSRFSSNVHYLDKTTDKTLFVDTGKAISMRRTGITESGVAVALQLAKQRFGSTLSINGTAEFKQLVIEAAAKNGIDVHFTDKAMNEGLAARRTEIEIEREGHDIAQPSAVDLKVVAATQMSTAQPVAASATAATTTPVTPAAAPTFKPEPVTLTVGTHPVQVDVSDHDQIAQVVKDLAFQKAALGDRIEMLNNQSAHLAGRLNTAPLTAVADLYPHTFDHERTRVTELGKMATAIPNNLLQDNIRLGWYREGVASTVESLGQVDPASDSSQPSRLASASAMLNTVDQFISTLEARSADVMQPPAGGMRFDDVVKKLDAISVEIAQTQQLRQQALRSLDQLSNAIAFQAVPLPVPTPVAPAPAPKLSPVMEPEARALQNAQPAMGPIEQSDRDWRASLALPEADISNSQTAMEVRGDKHASWLLVTSDNSPGSVALIAKCMENDSYRESFKSAVEGFYSDAEIRSPESIPRMDAAYSFAVDIVNEIEGRTAQGSAPAQQGNGRKAIEGVLVAHGSAPYQHNEKLKDKPPSYFVKIQPPTGPEREVWGVALKDVMDSEQFSTGDRIRLKDLGTQPVTVSEPQLDGSVKLIETHRREWSGERVGPAQEVEVSTPATVVHTLVEPAETEQDRGMDTD